MGFVAAFGKRLVISLYDSNSLYLLCSERCCMTSVDALLFGRNTILCERETSNGWPYWYQLAGRNLLLFYGAVLKVLVAGC